MLLRFYIACNGWIVKNIFEAFKHRLVQVALPHLAQRGQARAQAFLVIRQHIHSIGELLRFKNGKQHEQRREQRSNEEIGQACGDGSLGLGKEIHTEQAGGHRADHAERGDHGKTDDGGGLLALRIAVEILAHVP